MRGLSPSTENHWFRRFFVRGGFTSSPELFTRRTRPERPSCRLELEGMIVRDVIVYAVVDDALSPGFPLDD